MLDPLRRRGKGAGRTWPVSDDLGQHFQRCTMQGIDRVDDATGRFAVADVTSAGGGCHLMTARSASDGDASGDEGMPSPTPKPETMNSPADFLAGLRIARVTAGNPSLRDIHRVTGLPRSTIGHSLDPLRGQLPPWDRTLTLLRAFGVPESDQQRWAHAWRRIQLAAPAKPAATATMGAATTSGVPVGDAAADPTDDSQSADGQASLQAEELTRPTTPRSEPANRRRKVFTHGVAAFAGALLGAMVMLSVQGVPSNVAAPVGVTDAPPCPQPPKPPTSTGTAKNKPTPADVAATSTQPFWVARPASDAQILSLTDLDLPITTAVHDGDALIVSLMLTAVCPGSVSVSDSRDNHYETVSDVTDSLHHRTMILAAFNVDPLTTVDTIHLAYPRASKYHVAVDEFRGVSSAVQHSSAFGESGGTAFTTSGTAVACRFGDLVVAAVGTNSGTAPTFADGWQTLPVLKLSSYRLSTAYQIALGAAPCAVTGTTTAQWGAVVATFR